jgi:V-type H+-transporting ATPase subunit d
MLAYLGLGGVGGPASFNMDDGYLEAMVRGLKAGLLRSADYASLTQCDTLEDVRLQLQGTALGDFLRDEPAPLTTAALSRRLTERLVGDFDHLRVNAVPPLSTFLDLVRVGYMLDNVILVILGAARGRPAAELMEKCHPLGMFETLEALCSASLAPAGSAAAAGGGSGGGSGGGLGGGSGGGGGGGGGGGSSLAAAGGTSELLGMVLADTPLGKYFAGALRDEDVRDVDTELMRNRLWRCYLEDMGEFCAQLGGPTADVMGEVLGFEADRRVINIAINSAATELTRDDKRGLFPEMGRLFPDGTEKLARAEDMAGVMQAVEVHPPYRALLSEVQFNQGKSLEDAFFEYEVKLNKDAFERQFGYGIFYSYIRLREQEIRNIVWIGECISQQHRDQINNFIPLF